MVDDDAEMGQAIERLLSAAGYRTTTFQSAEALLNEEAPVRADCSPGHPLARHLRLRIAATSRAARRRSARDLHHGLRDLAAREQAQAAGAVALFAKPFKGQPLLAAIAGALVRT